MSLPLAREASLRDHRWTVPSSVLFHDLGGEAVLLELEGGQYYGLDEVGTRIWLLLVEHGDVQQVLELLLGEYDVDQERLREDLSVFLATLASKRLIVPDA